LAKISKERLIEDIKNTGLSPGSILVLHSSMKSIGWVEGGPNTVIDAFIKVLGAQGTLIVPTFTYGEKHRGRPFDPQTSESVTGLLTETFRFRPDSVRSIAPVHSVAAIGAQALELTRDHLYTTTLGRHSPLHRASKQGGYIMLLGCVHTSNSTIHVAESLAELPFNYVPTRTKPSGRVEIRQKDGRVKEIQLTEFTGCSNAFYRAEKPLRDAGIIFDAMVGEAKMQLMKSMEVLEVLTPLLRSNPGWLLCDDKNCEYCPPRMELLESLK
jgi:aminoglycoside 3-N-acetyltransferase